MFFLSDMCTYMRVSNSCTSHIYYLQVHVGQDLLDLHALANNICVKYMN